MMVQFHVGDQQPLAAAGDRLGDHVGRTVRHGRVEGRVGLIAVEPVERDVARDAGGQPVGRAGLGAKVLQRTRAAATVLSSRSAALGSAIRVRTLFIWIIRGEDQAPL